MVISPKRRGYPISTIAMENYNCKVWIGTRKGLLKGVDVSRSQFTNYGSTQELDPQKEVRALQWKDASETEILVGQRCGMVKRFHLDKRTFEDVSNVSSAFRGPDDWLAGVVWVDDGALLLTCTKSGRLIVDDLREAKTTADVHVGNHVACVCQNVTQPHQIAVGGHENELQVYDIGHLSSISKPVFQAKNVRNDFVDLRVPVSVTAIAFVPNSGDCPTVVVGSAHSHVRLYDTRTQRRPVVSITYGEAAVTALDVVPSGESVIVGNAHGTMSRLDLRKSLACVGGFKGAAGSITDIKCSGAYVASCGLDRYFRLHRIGNQKLLRNVYVKQEVSRVLLSSQLTQTISSESQVKHAVVTGIGKQTGGPTSAGELGDQELDAIWQDMDVVSEPSSKKPKLSTMKTQRKP